MNNVVTFSDASIDLDEIDMPEVEGMSAERVLELLGSSVAGREVLFAAAMSPAGAGGPAPGALPKVKAPKPPKVKKPKAPKAPKVPKPPKVKKPKVPKVPKVKKPKLAKDASGTKVVAAYASLGMGATSGITPQTSPFLFNQAAKLGMKPKKFEDISQYLWAEATGGPPPQLPPGVKQSDITNYANSAASWPPMDPNSQTYAMASQYVGQVLSAPAGPSPPLPPGLSYSDMQSFFNSTGSGF